MDTFLFLFSDHIWLPLLELCIAFAFFLAVYKDIHSRKVVSGPSVTIKRGDKSWWILLSFWGLSIIIVEIIISSEFIPNHKVIIGLLNVGVLVYLNLFNSYFRNKIIGWASKLMSREEK